MYKIIFFNSLNCSKSNKGWKSRKSWKCQVYIFYLNESGNRSIMPKKKEYNINLKPDDILFFYTDGITEAMNENKELFGEKRLKFFLDRLTEINSASKMLTAIDENVKKYVGSAPQSDDMTMLGLIYKKAG